MDGVMKERTRRVANSGPARSVNLVGHRFDMKRSQRRGTADGLGKDALGPNTMRSRLTATPPRATAATTTNGTPTRATPLKMRLTASFELPSRSPSADRCPGSMELSNIPPGVFSLRHTQGPHNLWSNIAASLGRYTVGGMGSKFNLAASFTNSGECEHGVARGFHRCLLSEP